MQNIVIGKIRKHSFSRDAYWSYKVDWVLAMEWPIQ